MLVLEESSRPSLCDFRSRGICTGGTAGKDNTRRPRIGPCRTVRLNRLCGVRRCSAPYAVSQNRSTGTAREEPPGRRGKLSVADRGPVPIPPVAAPSRKKYTPVKARFATTHGPFGIPIGPGTRPALGNSDSARSAANGPDIPSRRGTSEPSEGQDHGTDTSKFGPGESARGRRPVRPSGRRRPRPRVSAATAGRTAGGLRGRLSRRLRRLPPPALRRRLRRPATADTAAATAVRRRVRGRWLRRRLRRRRYGGNSPPPSPPRLRLRPVLTPRRPGPPTAAGRLSRPGSGLTLASARALPGYFEAGAFVIAPAPRGPGMGCGSSTPAGPRSRACLGTTRRVSPRSFLVPYARVRHRRGRGPNARPVTPPSGPPAVPLVAHDPYLSIWSEADRLTDDTTRHWTHREHAARQPDPRRRQGLPAHGQRPEGRPRRCRRSALQVFPTRSIYDFETASVHVTLTFMTPALPDDLDVLARPLTYLTWTSGRSTARTTQVSIYDSTSSQLAVEHARPGGRMVAARRSGEPDGAPRRDGRPDAPPPGGRRHPDQLGLRLRRRPVRRSRRRPSARAPRSLEELRRARHAPRQGRRRHAPRRQRRSARAGVRVRPRRGRRRAGLAAPDGRLRRDLRRSSSSARSSAPTGGGTGPRPPICSRPPSAITPASSGAARRSTRN